MTCRWRIVVLFALTIVNGFAGTTERVLASDRSDVSFRNELQLAIDRGLTWLRANQDTNGWWSTPDTPAITALAMASILGDPSKSFGHTNVPPEVRRAISYILSNAQSDGGIHRGKLVNYNTSICMMALAMTGDPAYNDVLLRARGFVANLQNNPGATNAQDTPFDGGVGYSGNTDHSDLDNTLVAIQAMRATGHLVKDTSAPGPDLNWNAAVQFIENCQNLPGRNTQTWVSTDRKDIGGFIYHPGRSNAGGVTNRNGVVALRSYGSMSYAGLLSYIYADVNRDDPRVRAVLDWLRSNYAVDENPGLGAQGYYYYLHLMTKGLNAAGVERLEIEGGRLVDWRREIALRLLELQQRDGSWVNTNARWLEKDPCLVTAYCILALEIIVRNEVP